MKSSFLFTLTLFTIILVGCTDKESYTIKGEILNKAYEGKTIYLTDIDDKDFKNSDSTIIVKGKFTFKDKSLEPEMKVLKVQPVWPQFMQELIVITEPGKIKVTIDTQSKGEGTKLNNTFQGWKALKKESDDKKQLLFKKKYKLKQNKNQNSEIIDSVQQEIQILEDRFIDSTAQLLIKNNQNILGQYLFKKYYFKIKKEEKEEILSTASEIFLNDETIKKILNDL